MNTNELIENYFSITKRPISTMTVEEYLAFCKMGGTISAAPPTSSNADTYSHILTKESSANEEKEPAPKKNENGSKKNVPRLTTHDSESRVVGAVSLLRSIPG